MTAKVLSRYAKDVLISLNVEDRPRQEINPGCAGMLEGMGLIRVVSAASPYAASRGQMIQWSRITQRGREYLGDHGLIIP